MISQKIFNVLQIIYNKLKNQDIKWVLVGSTSLALQRVDINPFDIDILSDRDGAYRIGELLKEYGVKPVEFGSSEDFRSYFGKFYLNNIKVEVMGNLEEKRGGEWFLFSNRLKSYRVVEHEGMKLPVSSLKDHLESYEKSGREKDKNKAEIIRRILEK